MVLPVSANPRECILVLRSQYSETIVRAIKGPGPATRACQPALQPEWVTFLSGTINEINL